MDSVSVVSFGILVTVLALVAVTAANVLFWPKVTKVPATESGVVSILIPARDEESNLADCLRCALDQGETVLEILLYDDHSRDRTPQILSEFTHMDARVRAVPARPLESGWCGKNFACAQLAEAAEGEFLLFIDADARLESRAVARMVAEMRARRLAMLSCWPGLEMESFWERALMPVLNFVVYTIFPAPASVIFNHHSLAVAHGACIMFTRESYERLGGHGAVRGEIFEDVRLAQLWRRRRERALCLDGQAAVRVRMYRSFDEIRRGFEKNFFPAFRREPGFWAFISFRLAVFLAPFFFLAWQPRWEAAAAVAGVISMRLMLAFYFRHPLWAVLLHPVAEVIVIFIGLSSWLRCRSGRGVSWKGREYRKRDNGTN
ncbi:MAG: glycosyltransferase [Acidobacteria bacterium]|nr:glycosyltransferase [Acidobacteriota bacterium]MCW5969617.1 glycosyltransferase [Blastocatellales bacterium]